MAKSLIPNKGKDINIKNKRAEFDYLLMDKYTAGLVLTGTEIKSIRKGKASLVDTYCYVIRQEYVYRAIRARQLQQPYGKARPKAPPQPQRDSQDTADSQVSRLQHRANPPVC